MSSEKQRRARRRAAARQWKLESKGLTPPQLLFLRAMNKAYPRRYWLSEYRQILRAAPTESARGAALP